MCAKILKDFNLLKVADVSSRSTTNNSFSVVVNADSQSSSGDAKLSERVSAHEKKENQTIFPSNLSTQPNSGEVIYGGLTDTMELENELKFYKLLSQTLSNILKDNNPKLIINLIDQSGKIIIDARTLIELIAVKTNNDPKLINIQFKEEEPGCLTKVNPIKSITNIKINNENFNWKYNREYNILQDDFNISLEKVIISY